MKQQISPSVAAGAVVVILVVAGLILWRMTGVQPSTTAPPTMPANVAQDWQKYTSGSGGGPAAPAGGSSIPAVPGGGAPGGGPPGGGPGFPSGGSSIPGAPGGPAMPGGPGR